MISKLKSSSLLAHNLNFYKNTAISRVQRNFSEFNKAEFENLEQKVNNSSNAKFAKLKYTFDNHVLYDRLDLQKNTKNRMDLVLNIIKGAVIPLSISCYFSVHSLLYATTMTCFAMGLFFYREKVRSEDRIFSIEISDDMKTLNFSCGAYSNIIEEVMVGDILSAEVSTLDNKKRVLRGRKEPQEENKILLKKIEFLNIYGLQRELYLYYHENKSVAEKYINNLDLLNVVLSGDTKSLKNYRYMPKNEEEVLINKD